MKVVFIALALVAYVNAKYDATSIVKKQAKTCVDFKKICNSGCRGGYSFKCKAVGRNTGGVTKWTFQPGTYCKCGKSWNTTPKRKQSDRKFLQQAYDLHNTLRAKHGAPPLRVDRTAAGVAKKWCRHLASTDGRLKHSSKQFRKGYGENLSKFWSSDGKRIVEGAEPVQGWYDEISLYNYAKPGFQKSTGHFTQLIWKSTTGVGCSRATSRSGAVFVCCNYTPAGNMVDPTNSARTAAIFRANVLPKQ